MSKYDALWRYVEKNTPHTLTFEEIQKICGFPIDHAFLTYKKELEAYGFKVIKISMKQQYVQFAPC